MGGAVSATIDGGPPATKQDCFARAEGCCLTDAFKRGAEPATPSAAVARGAEALHEAWTELPPEVHGRAASADLTRAALEAALVGVELGQVVRAHRPYYLRSGRASCGGCDWTFVPEWEGTESSERRTSARRAFSNHQGDAIRTMVLGEAP